MKIFNLKKPLLILLVLCFMLSQTSYMSSDVDPNKISDNHINYVSPNPEVYNNEVDKNSGKDNSKSFQVPTIEESKFYSGANNELVPAPGAIEEVLIIPIAFTNKNFSDDHNKQYFTGIVNEMKAYYEFNSSYIAGSKGMSINGTVTDVVYSSNTMEYYGEDLDTENLDERNTQIYELTREAVRMLDAQGFDFSNFDKNNDSIIDHIFIIHAGEGQEESLNDDLIWSHRFAIQDGENVDGKTVKNYIMVPETGLLGTYAHEFGHDIGLPDLYDTNGLQNGYTFGVGAWDIMGSGSWNHLDNQPAGSCPANLSAWSRMFLRWDAPNEINTNITINIENNSGLSNFVRLWPKGNILSNEYYLVEYRRKIGFDSGLPGEGVLVWHIDSEMLNTYFSTNTINNNELRQGIELEQADGNWDLWYLRNRGDSGDPFPGSSSNSNFISIPYNLNYSNIVSTEYTYVDMLNINVNGDTASANAYVVEDYPKNAPVVSNPEDNAITNSQPVFEWGLVAQSKEYVLQISENGAFTQNVLEFVLNGINDDLEYNSSGLHFKLPSSYELTKNKTYYWRVAGVNSKTSGNEVWSSVRSINTSLDTNGIPIDFTPADIVQHPTEPLLYLSDLNNKKVYSINYLTKEIKVITFDLPAERMTYYNGKLYVCLLKGAHSPYWWDYGDQRGAIAVINTSSFTVENKYDIDIDPYDIAIDNGGNICVSGGSGQSTRLVKYSANNFTVVAFFSINYQNLIEYNPQVSNLYTITTNLSPRDIYVFNDLNGSVIEYDSPYHGVYTMTKYFNISPDGKYIFNGAGTIFNCSNTKTDDVIYHASLGVPFNNIAFDIPSDRFYTATTTGYLNEYKYSTLELLGSYKLNKAFQYLFNKENNLITVKESETSGCLIEVLPKQYIHLDPISFSFDGNHAGRLMGSTVDLEYSLDGGLSYSTVTYNDMQLSSLELSIISAQKDIMVRKKATATMAAGFLISIDILEGPSEPRLIWNDSHNAIFGLDSKMEYNLKQSEWLTYNANLPNLSSDTSISIRKRATGVTLPGDILTIMFTTGSYQEDDNVLNFSPADTILHPESPILYLSCKEGKKIFAINYVTNIISTIAFDDMPDQMAYRNGRLYVSLLKGNHSSYWWDDGQQGSIGVVNTSTFTTENIYDIAINPFDIAVDSNGVLYVSSGSGQWTNLKSFSLINMAEIGVITNVRQRSYLEYHPFFNKLYTIDTDSSPRDMEAYVTNNGAFSTRYDTIYHGDYSMKTYFKISPDGKYILNGAGTIFKCVEAANRSLDMLYYKSIPDIYKSIAFNTAEDEMYLGLENGNIAVYKYSDFSYKKTIQTGYTSEMLYFRDGVYISFESRDSGNMHMSMFNPTAPPTAPSINFSFSGNDSGKLMGSTSQMEYSINGGSTYNAINTNNYQLSNTEIASITAANDIRVRVKASLPTPAGIDRILNVLTGSVAPSITADDANNTIIGMNSLMEFSTDTINWTKYVNNLPDLSDNKQISIRYYANALTLRSASITLIFTKPVAPPAPSINFSFSGVDPGKLMGSTSQMEYSFNGGSTYTPINSNNYQLSNTEIASITATNDIRVRVKANFPTLAGSDCILNVLTGPAAPSVTADDTNNTIIGMNSSMEFSIDTINWTKYINNLPDLSNNTQINVRYFANALTLRSASISLTFTKPVDTATVNPPVIPSFPAVPASPTPATPVLPIPTTPSGADVIDSDYINDRLNENLPNIDIPFSDETGNNSVTLSQEIFSLLTENSKNIVLTSPAVEIIISPDAFSSEDLGKQGSNAQVQIQANPLNKGDIASSIAGSMKNDGIGLFSIGNTVFEFKCQIVTDGKTTAVTEFKKDLTITISLDEIGAADDFDVDKLGVYYYNETTSKWEYVGGIYDENAKTLTFTTNHFSLYSVMQHNKTFDDIQNHWAKKDLEEMASKYVVNGKTDKLFDPDNTTKKAEFIALVVRALRLKPNDKLLLPLKDVDPLKWYYSEISSAYNWGILDSKAVSFNPEREITREEMMVIISQALKVSGNYIVLTDGEVDKLLKSYADADKLSKSNREAVALVIKNGIIQGRTSTLIAPDETATRAETIVVIKRLLDIVEKNILDKL